MVPCSNSSVVDMFFFLYKYLGTSDRQWVHKVHGFSSLSQNYQITTDDKLEDSLWSTILHGPYLHLATVQDLFVLTVNSVNILYFLPQIHSLRDRS